jgi:hypothetical protein
MLRQLEMQRAKLQQLTDKKRELELLLQVCVICVMCVCVCV